MFCLSTISVLLALSSLLADISSPISLLASVGHSSLISFLVAALTNIPLSFVSVLTGCLSFIPLIADAPSADIEVLSDMFKWTLGSIFAGLSSMGIALAWLGKFLLDRVFNEDTDSKGIPKGVLPRMHSVAVQKLGGVESHMADLVNSLKTVATHIPPETASILQSIDDRLTALTEADRTHAAQYAEIKKLILDLHQTIAKAS